METITIEAFGNKIECKEFFDIVGTSTEISGIELYYKDGDRIGSMLGVSLPDLLDQDELNEFRDKLECWLIDNTNDY